MRNPLIDMRVLLSPADDSGHRATAQARQRTLRGLQ